MFCIAAGNTGDLWKEKPYWHKGEVEIILMFSSGLILLGVYYQGFFFRMYRPSINQVNQSWCLSTSKNYHFVWNWQVVALDNEQMKTLMVQWAKNNWSYTRWPRWAHIPTVALSYWENPNNSHTSLYHISLHRIIGVVQTHAVVSLTFRCCGYCCPIRVLQAESRCWHDSIESFTYLKSIIISASVAAPVYYEQSISWTSLRCTCTYVPHVCTHIAYYVQDAYCPHTAPVFF